MDHLEDFPARATFRDAIEKITMLALTVAGMLLIDIATLVRERWAQVEQTSIFRQANL